MQLSIIVPAYNVGGYIEKCIQSLQQQDIPKEEYEVIVVNDGSSDNSLEVLMQLTKTFNNVVCIDQVNKGVSLARNAGIDKAKGKYLLFIDADDFVAPCSFSYVLKTANDLKAQVMYLGYKVLNSDNSVDREIFFDKKGIVYTGIKAYTLSRVAGTPDPDRSCGILYLKDFINENQLRFTPQVPILEDGEFVAKVLCLATNCGFDDTPFYLRTTREGSAINSNVFFSEKAISGFIKVAENLKYFQQKKSLSEEQKQFLNQPICKFVLLSVNSSSGNKGKLGLGVVKITLKEKGLLKCDLNGCNKPYNREGFIFNLSPDIYAYYKKVKVRIDHAILKYFKVVIKT